METSKGFQTLKQLIENKTNLDAMAGTANSKFRKTGGDGDMVWDSSDLEKWRMVQGATNVPRKTVGYTDDKEKAFLVQPNYGMRDLNSAD